MQPRLTGPATDFGADEFLNLPPLASFKATPTNPRAGQVVTFDASASRDLEGAGIIKYSWDFGDGTTAETTTPTTQHAYANLGTYMPKIVVVDPQGNASAATLGPAVTVVDGKAPTVTVTTPKNKSKRHIFNTTKSKSGKKTKTRQLFTFRGTAADESGIATVAMSLRRVSLTKTAKEAATTCVYLDKTKFVSKNCRTPVYFFVKVDDDGFWAFRTKKATVFRAGTYELIVLSKDKAGNISAPAKITFTLT
jgi:PKD repeat protein